MAQLVEGELDSFHHTHIDLDKCKCALSWWRMEEHRFPIVSLVFDKSLKFQLVKLRYSGFSRLLEFSLHSEGVGCKLKTLTR
jgi:hypothetical protein